MILTKDSGGTHTVAKLDAAGDLGIPVVIIARPEPAPIPLLRTVAEAAARSLEVCDAPRRADRARDPLTSSFARKRRAVSSLVLRSAGRDPRTSATLRRPANRALNPLTSSCPEN